MPVENAPQIFKSVLQSKTADKHKYDYGYVVIMGGRHMTGATCLAGKSALRMGAGLVTIVSYAEIANVYRSFCPSLIVEETEHLAQFATHFVDTRRNVILIGCGIGQDNEGALKKAVLDSVQSGKICVLDADALNVFQDNPNELLSHTHTKCILTPHEGEFAKLFPDVKGSREERVLKAAQISKSVVVLKGAETLIAAPDAEGCSRIVINRNASPWLATAGTGDVLAGMIAGLAAWHSDKLFDVACAAVWMHGEASKCAGAGMISADLPDLIPVVLKVHLNA